MITQNVQQHVQSENLIIGTHLPIKRLLHADFNSTGKFVVLNTNWYSATPWKVISGAVNLLSTPNVIQQNIAVASHDITPHILSTAATIGAIARIVRNMGLPMLTNFITTEKSINVCFQYTLNIIMPIEVNDYIKIKCFKPASNAYIRIVLIFKSSTAYFFRFYFSNNGSAEIVITNDIYFYGNPNNSAFTFNITLFYKNYNLSGELTSIHVNDFILKPISHAFNSDTSSNIELDISLYTSVAVAKTITIPHVIIYETF